MGKLVLITGGARSGKSSFAEKMAAACGSNVLYVATSIPFDEEMKERVRKHRDRRPASWHTLEAYKDLIRLIPQSANGCSAVLLDCITILVTNLMLEEDIDWNNIVPARVDEVEKKVRKEIEGLISIRHQVKADMFVVTNEVGMGLVPEYPLGRAFRDICGRVNQILAQSADEVWFCVSGIPMRIKPR